jgi:hypothetical protein
MALIAINTPVTRSVIKPLTPVTKPLTPVTMARKWFNNRIIYMRHFNTSEWSIKEPFRDVASLRMRAVIGASMFGDFYG